MSENFPVFVCSFNTSHITCVFCRKEIDLPVSKVQQPHGSHESHFTSERWPDERVFFLKKRLVGDTRWFSKSLRCCDLHHVKILPRLRWCQYDTYDTEWKKPMEMRTSWGVFHPKFSIHTSLLPRKNSAGEKAVHLLLHVSGLARPWGGWMFPRKKAPATSAAIVWFRNPRELISWVSKY